MVHSGGSCASALVVLLGLGSCASPPVQPEPLDRGARAEGQAGGIAVVIHNGVVSAGVERRHEVDQLVAAAEAAMRSRGFTPPVDEKRGRLEEPLVITGQMGGTPGSRRVEISLLIGPTKLRIAVTVRPWGNDAESRAILKRMLELLGYGDEG